MTRGCLVALLALVLTGLTGLPAPRVAQAEDATPSAAKPEPSANASASAKPEPTNDLQSPAHRSTRRSAYSLPAGTWGFDVGMLGLNADDLYGTLGFARGFKHGLQLSGNLLHWSAALFNVSLRWNFWSSPHFALGAEFGIYYAHGAWLWLLEEREQKLVSDTDVLAFPMSVTASAPITRWLQLDLGLQYRHAETYGTLVDGSSIYVDSELGARQLALFPTLRLFVSSATAIELSTKLPAYSHVPASLDTSVGERDKSRSRDLKIPFSDSWTVDLGVRSRLTHRVYANLRMQFGALAKTVYGSSLFPSFSLEVRL